ncbi:MAG: type II toxin-antitoxin system HicA family toxin [Nitrospinae bacterium]|nr:type II toxin-antitoxin system HicA family toxin [Nitrospinota bacterium]
MPYSFREIERRLKKIGYRIVRQGKGSHVIFSNGHITFPVPRHGGNDISPGVERKILKLIGMKAEEFRAL